MVQSYVDISTQYTAHYFTFQAYIYMKLYLFYACPSTLLGRQIVRLDREGEKEKGGGGATQREGRTELTRSLTRFDCWDLSNDTWLSTNALSRKLKFTEAELS